MLILQQCSVVGSVTAVSSSDLCESVVSGSESGRYCTNATEMFLAQTGVSECLNSGVQ